jgi:dihydroxyacetone kinase
MVLLEENNRRGVAGLFYAYKVAGACVDMGGSLEEVYQTTKEALKNVRSLLGVAISPCTVPDFVRNARFFDYFIQIE